MADKSEVIEDSTITPLLVGGLESANLSSSMFHDQRSSNAVFKVLRFEAPAPSIQQQHCVYVPSITSIMMSLITILYPVIHISSPHFIPNYSSLNLHPTNLIFKNKYDCMLKNEIPYKGGLITSSLDTTEGHQVGGDLEEGRYSGVIRRSVRLDHPIPSTEVETPRK
ncbi:hypothetical protein QJS10_CPA06g00860 [Acorus calamus]|uniref:Uncharacterized protein n=1 Tax=Acorus calamus TaxID=4465 RepID=A0AAV9EHH2_ACOCL|nr:hypothetical protein QJS10_CPA06g00860 [Acorus calamus]